MTQSWRARQWAVGLLRGDAAEMPQSAAEQADALRLAESEGVISLLYSHLAERSRCAPVPPELLSTFATSARMRAAHALMLQTECQRITAALQQAGVESIWLKGVAVAHWLYDQPNLRDVADADLLLASHGDSLRAAEVLAGLGFSLPNPHVAGDQVVHELLAVSSRSGLELDLHWALGNSVLYANRLTWDELRAHAVPLPALGEGALALGTTHALLHAAIHLALNNVTGWGWRLRWLYDLHLMAQRLTADQWRDVLELAGRRGLADTCLEALRRTRDVLGTDVPDEVMASLADQAVHEPFRAARLRSWPYLQWASMRAIPGWGLRMRWLRQLLVPDMEHLRVRYEGGVDVGPALLVWRRLLDGQQRLRGYLLRKRG